MTFSCGICSPKTSDDHVSDDSCLFRESPVEAIVAEVPTQMQRLALKCLATAPHQHRHIGTLPTTISVQLVKNQEPQVAGVLDQLPSSMRVRISSSIT